ncbi:MAG TPA: ABC transporter ATP-binding protein [Clostridia bacterium]|nr:ABC transporter ATP-binding protein [Clostridia bacterium]
MLTVKNIHVYYDTIHALKDISFAVNAGEIVTLIGANGAGKTSILHTISGLIPSKSGSIFFGDADITKTPAHEIVHMRLAQVPEGRRIFTQMTVLENLQMGAYSRRNKAEIAQDMERVFHSFPRLQERRKQLAGTLSGGEQQMLAMGRALMSNPTLLMLDEPSMGLAPMLVAEIFRIIRQINERGCTVLLVEQNARMALSIADRAYVLETGRIVLEGSASEMMGNPRVQEAYLGN